MLIIVFHPNYGNNKVTAVGVALTNFCFRQRTNKHIKMNTHTNEKTHKNEHTYKRTSIKTNKQTNIKTNTHTNEHI
jgi:hypothetical protein